MHPRPPHPVQRLGGNTLGSIFCSVFQRKHRVLRTVQHAAFACVARGPQRVIGGDARPPNTPLTVCTHLMFWADLWSKCSFSNCLPPSFFFLATLVFVAESGLFSSCGVQAPQLRCVHPLVVMHVSSGCDARVLWLCCTRPLVVTCRLSS